MPNDSPRRFTTDHLVTLLTPRDDDVIVWSETRAASTGRRVTWSRLGLVALLTLTIGAAGTWVSLQATGRLIAPGTLAQKDSQLSRQEEQIQTISARNTELEKELRIAAEAHAEEMGEVLASITETGEIALQAAMEWTEEGRYSEAIASLRAFDSYIEEKELSRSLADVFVEAIRAAIPELQDNDDPALDELRRLLEEMVSKYAE
ncbi:MAG: hypothetical protein AAF432_04495 [Planctomycetota bacterium]